ncbi:MAG TPA: hypothetical protein VMP11_02730 [Verrucomicrobiae bacterium]|nr:hypothetical protein [Verrucomicrobiae bacterium]
MATSTVAPKAGTTHARPKAKDDKAGGKKEAKVVYPSDFGSHASMANEELTGKIAAARQDAGDPWMILKDERGDYATRKSRLDSGLADPSRCADQPAREKVVKELTAA